MAGKAQQLNNRRKYPRQFVAWRCRACGCAGVTGGKDTENLLRGIRRHHNDKSKNCRFFRENVLIKEPQIFETTIQRRTSVQLSY